MSTKNTTKENLIFLMSTLIKNQDDIPSSNPFYFDDKGQINYYIHTHLANYVDKDLFFNNLTKAKSKEDFLILLEEQIMDQIAFELEQDIENLKHSLTESEQELLDYLPEYVHMEDFNLEHYLDDIFYQMDPDIVIYFGDKEENGEYYWHLYKHDASILEEIEKESSLIKLVKTQGYETKDIFDEEKRLNSKFLSSVYEELFDYTNDLSYTTLTANPKSRNSDKILDLYFNKTGVLKKGTLIGLFQPFAGSGSGFSIELEHDLVLTPDLAHDVRLSGGPNDDFYTPDEVYGFYYDDYNQLA